MHPQRHHGTAAALLLAALLLAACSGSDGGSAGATVPPPATSTLANRPHSTAKLSIVSPHNGQTIHGGAQELRLALKGAKIVPQTTTRIRPDQGHVHLLVDGKLVAMNYGLTERLPTLTPGQHVIQVEFVAADHLPFDPRVLVQAAFQVVP
jgi:hypothetical protein